MTDAHNFIVVIAIQFLLFFCIYFFRRKRGIKQILPISVLLGIIFGVPFDLIFGKYLGIFEYSFGFSIPFLILNGALSYGAMIATVWTIHKAKFFHFYLHTVGIGVIYEIANTMFPVWEWTFNESTFFQIIVLVFAAYFGLAALMLIVILASENLRLKKY